VLGEHEGHSGRIDDRCRSQLELAPRQPGSSRAVATVRDADDAAANWHRSAVAVVDLAAHQDLELRPGASCGGLARGLSVGDRHDRPRRTLIEELA
jgi:hypothetical protein